MLDRFDLGDIGEVDGLETYTGTLRLLQDYYSMSELSDGDDRDARVRVHNQFKCLRDLAYALNDGKKALTNCL